MEAEVAKRVAMVAVIPALLILILATPSLMGRPTLLSAIPALVIGIAGDDVVLDIHGAVDHYLYRWIQLDVQSLGNASWSRSAAESETYDVDLRFARNETPAFDVFVVIVDRQRITYALNATVYVGTDDTGDFVGMTNRDTLRSELAYAPSDLRALIPRGEGT